MKYGRLDPRFYLGLDDAVDPETKRLIDCSPPKIEQAKKDVADAKIRYRKLTKLRKSKQRRTAAMIRNGEVVPFPSKTKDSKA